MADRFLIFLVAAVVITAIATTLSMKRGVRFGMIVKAAFVCSVVSIPVSSFAIGTFYSHGFDIPAWGFGIVIALAIMLVTLISAGLYKLASDVRKER